MRHEEDWWLGGFLAGFIVGFILAFGYTRLVPYTPFVTPAQLDPGDKEIYLVLIAAAYRFDNDLEKAMGRLARLKEPNINQTIATLAEKYIATGADVNDIRSLVGLATALGETRGAWMVYLITPTFTPTTTPTPTITLTFTPSPTPTLVPTSTPTAQNTPTATHTPTVNATITLRPTPTPGPDAPFGLAQSVALCDNSADGILRVYVRDRHGNGVSGVEVLVSWPGGQDKFFTGLKSENDTGYADFKMEAGQIYQIELLSVPASVVKDINIAADTLCPNIPDGIAPSWQVVFQQGAGR